MNKSVRKPKIIIKGSGIRMRLYCNFDDERLKSKMLVDMLSDSWDSDEYKEYVTAYAVRMARHIKIKRSTRFVIGFKKAWNSVCTFFLRLKIAFSIPKEDIRRHQYVAENHNT